MKIEKLKFPFLYIFYQPSFFIFLIPGVSVEEQDKMAQRIARFGNNATNYTVVQDSDEG